MENLIFRIQAKIYREISRILKYRPTSYPYISGDGFRSMAKHVYDEIEKCNPQNINHGDIIFLKSDKIKEWFELIHPQINTSYKLITHNGDDVVGENEIRYIDHKIMKWFAQNNITKHEKIVPIPIGIENKKLFATGWVFSKKINKLKKIRPERKNKILFGFSVTTNPNERADAQRNLQKGLLSDEIKNRINPIEYFELLNQYKFVASPEGNGPDCIRTWEAIILGVVPIIKNTSNNQILTQNSLPILLIDNWEDIGNMTEGYLTEKYNEYDFSKKSDITMFDYWQKIIKKYE